MRNKKKIEQIARILKNKSVPKCPCCGNPLFEIVEDIRGLRITWHFEKGKYEEIDKDYYGESRAFCGKCETDLKPEHWDFWLDNIH